MSPWIWIALVAFIAANALYVAAEFAGVGVRRSRVRRLSEDGNWFASRLLPHVENPQALDEYVSASQVGITLSSLGLGAYAQAAFGGAFVPWLTSLFELTPLAALSVSAVLVLVLLTAAQLVLGELVPKALALQYPTEVALATVLPMQWTLVVCKPIIRVLNGAALLFLRLAGAREHGHHHLHSPEEIDLLIAESRDGGLLEPQEQQRLRRALHFGAKHARDLMVPLDRLNMLEVASPWAEVLERVSASPFSRLPVYRESPARIVGLLRVKDLVERFASEGPTPLTRLLRPVLSLSADLPADQTLATLRERRANAAVVIDANGLALGLITIQDLLGELLIVKPAQVTTSPVVSRGTS